MGQSTSKERQALRNAALNEIARRAGWKSWSEYETAVKNGTKIVRKKKEGG